MTQENTVISILFINGMEIVGRFVSETNVELKVYKPRMAQMSQQGVGLIPSITATGKEIDGEFLGRLVLGVEGEDVKVFGATIY